jgi:gliding motility-associated-like protein
MKKTVLFRIICIFLFFISVGKTYGINVPMFNGTQPITDIGNFYDEGGQNNPYTATVSGNTILTIQSQMSNNFGSGWVVSHLQFNFTFFALGVGDTLFIYDGPTTNGPLIGAYNSVNSPGQFTSDSTSVTFVFYSDGIADLNGLNEGWKASFAPYFTTPYTYNLSSSLPFTQIRTCNAILYDSGGPTSNFAANDNGVIVFKSNLGTHIKAEKVSFSVGTNNILEIFDGDFQQDPTNARRIGYFKTGFEPPDVLISSGNAMTFRFITTSTGIGFQFNISCIPEIYEQGVTESACPKVELGQYTEGPFVTTDEFEVNCLNPVTILRANINAPGKLTNDYMIQSIDYNPPFAWYGAGMTQVPSSIDDNYLGPKPLTPVGSPNPFSFAFYGVNYDYCVPTTNGFITFNNIPYGPAGWQFTESIPNTASPSYNFISSYNYKNSIFGVLQDTDPHVASVPNYGVYYGHQGEYPCRTFVLSYYRLPQFSCNSDNLSTYQIVLYEGSNIIDIYIQDRTVCANWNTGSGLVGLLNAAGNQAVVPPGRNSGPWTAHNEAWRFIPIAAPDYTLKWYKNIVNPANEIPNANLDKRNISVSPTETTNYIAVLEYQTSSGQTYTFYDTTRAILELPAIDAISSVPSVCPNDPVELSLITVNPDDSTQIASVEWRNGSTVVGNTKTLTLNPGETTLYTAYITYQNQCENSDTITIQVPDLDKPVIVGDTVICEGERTTLMITNAQGNYEWSTGATTQNIVASPSSTTEYIVGVTTEIGCTTKDSIVVNVNTAPIAAFTPNPPHVYVENGEGPISFVNLSQFAQFYSWNFNDSYCLPSDNISDLETPIHIYTRSGKYKVSLTVETDQGCSDSISQFVVVEVPYFFYAPNAFTPNSDGINDLFYTAGEGIDPDFFEMLIYNKYGNVVFRSKTPFDSWDGLDRDGSKAPSGVYIYVITTQDMDGNPKRYEGSVNLIR